MTNFYNLQKLEIYGNLNYFYVHNGIRARPRRATIGHVKNITENTRVSRFPLYVVAHSLLIAFDFLFFFLVSITKFTSTALVYGRELTLITIENYPIGNIEFNCWLVIMGRATVMINGCFAWVYIDGNNDMLSCSECYDNMIYRVYVSLSAEKI